MKNSKIEVRRLDFKLDAQPGDEMKVSGYIQTDAPSHLLGKTDKWKEIISPGVFARALDYARSIGRPIDFLMDHDPGKILATTDNHSMSLDEDEVGLYIDAKISPTSWGKDCFVLISDGIIRGLSFGMKVLNQRWSKNEDNVLIRHILDIELFEISALKTPAYPNTLLESRGYDVIDEDNLEVPQNVEGGKDLGNEEITPLMIYEAMIAIGEKLDLIADKTDIVRKSQSEEEIKNAERILTEAKTVAEMVAKQTNPAASVTSEEVTTETGNPMAEDAAETKALEDPLEDPIDEEVDPDNTDPADDDGKDATETTEEVVDPEDGKDVEEETRATDENVDKEIIEEKDETIETKDKKKDGLNEFRSIFSTLKTEVPDIG